MIKQTVLLHNEALCSQKNDDDLYEWAGRAIQDIFLTERNKIQKNIYNESTFHLIKTVAKQKCIYTFLCKNRESKSNSNGIDYLQRVGGKRVAKIEG